MTRGGFAEGIADVTNLLGGKYAGECSALHELTQAGVVLLLVVGGDRGHGFAISIDNRKHDPAIALAELPAFLRQVADGIEKTGLIGPPIPAAGQA